MKDGVSTQEELSQYLTFILNDEEYGIPILKVRGIKGWEKTIPIPNSPNYVKGIINLRGEVVPIIDLRKRFNLEEIPYGVHTVVIIVNVSDDNNDKIVGFVVDAVADVHDFDEGEMRNPPEFGGTLNGDFVNGLGLNDDKLVILLNVNALADWSNTSSSNFNSPLKINRSDNDSTKNSVLA